MGVIGESFRQHAPLQRQVCAMLAPCALMSGLGLLLDLVLIRHGVFGHVCAVPRSVTQAAIGNIAMMPFMNIGMAAGAAWAVAWSSAAMLAGGRAAITRPFCIAAHAAMLISLWLGPVLPPLRVMSPWQAAGFMGVAMAAVGAIFVVLPHEARAPTRHGAMP